MVTVGRCDMLAELAWMLMSLKAELIDFLLLQAKVMKFEWV